MTSLNIMYITCFKPFKESSMTRLEIFNEICILICAYHLLIFTPFVPDVKIQYDIGWSIIAVTALNVGVNMIIILVNAIKAFKQLFLKIKNKCKERLNR